MTQQRDITSLLDLWLTEGSSVAPDRVIDVVTDRIERQRQRGSWRVPTWEIRMPTLVRLAAVAAALALVTTAAIYFAGSSRPSLTPPSSSPSPTFAVPPSPSPSPYVLSSGLPYPTARTFSSSASYPGFQLDVPTGWSTFTSTGGMSLTLGLIHDDVFGDSGHVGGSILFRLNPVLGSAASCPSERSAAPTVGPPMPAAAMAASLLADPRYSVTTSPGITIDGRPAQVLEVHLAADYAGSCMADVGVPSALLFDEPGSFVVLEGERRVQLILLDVDGVPLVIMFWPEEETYDAFVARAIGLIGGLTFLP